MPLDSRYYMVVNDHNIIYMIVNDLLVFFIFFYNDLLVFGITFHNSIQLLS